MNKFLEKRRSQSKLKSMFLYRPLYEQFKGVILKRKKKKGDSLWPWFGTLSLIDWVTSSLGLVRG